MSLISLSSSDKNHNTSQQPFNFRNNFSQPLIIKPHSQVALVNFYHFRNDNEYIITNQNNRIVYNFNNPAANGRYTAFLQPDKYDGGELAIEIARALNESNVAFQNYNFSCAFTQGNPNANPITHDQFEITFVSVATPAENAGVFTNMLDDAGASIAIDGALTNVRRQTIPNTYSTVQEQKGIHNHEGTWVTSGWTLMRGRNTNFLINDGANDVYDYSFGDEKIMGLYSEDLCSLNNPDPTKTFRKDRGTIIVELRRQNIRIKRLNRTTNTMQTKRNILLTRDGTLHTALSNFLFTAAARWKDIMYRFKFIKDGAANVAIQLQVSADGGLTYQVPTEADNTGAVFGVNADGSPNVYGQQTINTVNYNGIIYQSKQNGNPNAGGGNNNGLDSSNILNKAFGKYRCIVSTDDNFVPNAGGGDIENSRFDLLSRTFDVNYGGGGSRFDFTTAAHAGGVAFDFDVSTANQSGTPAGGQVIATELNNTALKVNLTKNALGLVFDIHADKTNAASAVIGEFHIERMASNNSFRGNVSLQNFAGALAGKGNVFDISVPTSALQARTRQQVLLKVSGVFNQDNRAFLKSAGIVAPPQFHSAGHEGIHDAANIVNTLVGTDLSSRLVMLLSRITQEDLDNDATLSASPFNLNINTPSGTIGKLIGFSNHVVSMAAPATNQPVDPTNPFRSDVLTLVIAKDTTLHVSIPELSGVKSHEGESSQQYKTIKIIPKSDFQAGSNGSLTFTSNYLDFIDINNASELQLNELTVQVREPDGRMATALEPVTRATIKIIQDPAMVEQDRMTKIMDRLERLMSQNQKQIPVIQNPQKTYT